MACGCPVLATNVGGVPNVVEDGVNGILVPPKDPHRMAAAIQTLLADPEKLNKMGFQARNTIEQGFSWEKIGSKFVDHYSSMLPMGDRLTLLLKSVCLIASGIGGATGHSSPGAIWPRLPASWLRWGIRLPC